MKYTIDYEHGIAELYTPSIDWENRFDDLASECFGIRKSIGEVKLLSTSNENPSWKVVGEFERLEHSGGDVIVWDIDGNKIKNEWD